MASTAHPVLATVQERVAYIERLMSEAKWQTRVTDRELSERWDVARSTIRNYSAEAHRNLMFDPQELAELRLRLALESEQAKRSALTIPNKKTGQIDVAGAIRAMEFQAKVLGLDLEGDTSPREPLEITIVDAEDDRPGPPSEGGAPGSDTR